MPAIRSDLPALVLDSHDYGESDKIVVFFCQEVGRISALARGAHRSKKRFLNKLEIFTFLQISYSRASAGGLYMLTEAELVNSFITLRTNLTSYRAASIVREYLLLATRETSDDDQLFQLALWAFHSLNSGVDQHQSLALFLIKFFDVLGYRPDLSTCRNCQTRPAGNDEVWFHVLSGTMLCPNCGSGREPGHRRLTAGATQMINTVQQQPIVRLNRFKPSGPLLAQILDCAYHYSRHLFQRDIHSWKWLDNNSLRL